MASRVIASWSRVPGLASVRRCAAICVADFSQPGIRSFAAGYRNMYLIVFRRAFAVAAVVSALAARTTAIRPQLIGGAAALLAGSLALAILHAHSPVWLLLAVSTAMYLGAIASASLIGLCSGHRATDPGIHHLALILIIVSATLLVSTIVDHKRLVRQ